MLCVCQHWHRHVWTPSNSVWCHHRTAVLLSAICNHVLACGQSESRITNTLLIDDVYDVINQCNGGFLEQKFIWQVQMTSGEDLDEIVDFVLFFMSSTCLNTLPLILWCHLFLPTMLSLCEHQTKKHKHYTFGSDGLTSLILRAWNNSLTIWHTHEG